MPKEVKQISKNAPNFFTSFNAKKHINKNVNIIIVGTVTPPSVGYFYLAKYNRIYGYIDAAYNTNLKKIKMDYWNNKIDLNTAVKHIKSVLDNNNIGFIDTIKCGTRKPYKQNSYRDNDIDSYVLDYNAFNNINPKAKIICNSIFAYENLQMIRKKLNLNNNIEFISQRRGKKVDWIKALQ